MLAWRVQISYICAMDSTFDTLKRARKAAKVTQEDAGEHIGCSRYRIGEIESGRGRISLSDFDSLLSLYGSISAVLPAKYSQIIESLS